MNKIKCCHPTSSRLARRSGSLGAGRHRAWDTCLAPGRRIGPFLEWEGFTRVPRGLTSRINLLGRG